MSSRSAEIDNSYGTGLTLINRGMHEGSIRNGVYRFGVWTDDGWTRKELDVSAFAFRRDAMVSPEPNLYFAAAILNVFGQQCPEIDRALIPRLTGMRFLTSCGGTVWGTRRRKTESSPPGGGC